MIKLYSTSAAVSYNKVERSIESCQTIRQVDSALRMVDLLKELFGDELPERLFTKLYKDVEKKCIELGV